MALADKRKYLTRSNTKLTEKKAPELSIGLKKVITRSNTKIEEKPVEEEKASPNKLNMDNEAEKVSPKKPEQDAKARHTEFSFDPNVIEGAFNS